MENYGIFGQLATESHEQKVVDEATIMEEIAAEEAYADALSIEADMEKDLTAMAQAQVAADRLEAQVSHEEMMLAKPEQITVSAVALAQESLATTAMLLGAPVSVLAPAVSQEAAEANPVSAMQISQEGAKDFLKKVIESIKAIFRKVMNSAKKLYVKLVVAMNGTAKKAEKLKKHVEKDLKGAVLTEKKFKEKPSIKMRKSLVLDGDTNINVNEISKVMSVLTKVIEDKEAAADKAITAETNAPTVATASADTAAATADAAPKASDDAVKEGDGAASKDVETLEETTTTTSLDYTPAEEGSKLYVTSNSGSKVHAIEVYTNTDDKLIIKSRVIGADMSKDDSSEMDVDSLDTVKNTLDDVILKAKGIPKKKDIVMKFIEGANKKLDKMAKDSSKGKMSYMLNKVIAGNATLLRDLTVTNALNTILDEVKLTKAKFSKASKHAGMYAAKGASM